MRAVFDIATKPECVLSTILDNLEELVQRMADHFGIDCVVSWQMETDPPGYKFFVDWEDSINMERIADCYLADLREMAQAAGKSFEYTVRNP